MAVAPVNQTAAGPAWLSQCETKVRQLQDAIRLIRPGDRLYLSAGSAAPHGLIAGLIDENAPLGDNEITHLLTLGDAPYARPEYASRFRHNALFIGPNVRRAVIEGRADYTPAFLSELPRLIRSGRIAIDVALLSVSAPDEFGYCTFGTHVDLAPAATDVARIVIAEVNARMPRSNGPARIHVDQIAALVPTDYALPELPPRDGQPEAEAIARHIAELVPDGATLQLGIGGIPDRVLSFLSDRRDLGVHTEMFSDGLVALVERASSMAGASRSIPERSSRVSYSGRAAYTISSTTIPS
jgi:acyl-CoA hydrolase